MLKVISLTIKKVKYQNDTIIDKNPVLFFFSISMYPSIFYYYLFFLQYII